MKAKLAVIAGLLCISSAGDTSKYAKFERDCPLPYC
ncbi:Uncharacterised protein [Budvicia aquatica]|uniref:Uncharacterized protein n=1 Tax=Budvicia aquatica TaxID=82979 RepID=A0A484ZMW8_9GAMM|nr:Uncharacterised protein [Budvicia aquatica]